MVLTSIIKETSKDDIPSLKYSRVVKDVSRKHDRNLDLLFLWEEIFEEFIFTFLSMIRKIG